MSLEKRRRLSPEESRATALEVSRELLIEAGPQAVTLKAVGARMGRTHANLLHHFGSAFELQKALAAYMANMVCSDIGEAMRSKPPGERDVRHLVNMTFDAFDTGGAAALASWMLLSGNDDALDPIVAAIHALIENLSPDADEKRMLREDTMALVLMALGDAQMGDRLAGALDLPRSTARALATELIESRVRVFVAARKAAAADAV